MGRFLQILQPKGFFRSLFLCISCIYETSKPLPVAKERQSQWEGVFNKGFMLHTRGPWTAMPALIEVKETDKMNLFWRLNASFKICLRYP